MVELALANARVGLNGRNADDGLVGDSDLIRFFQDGVTPGNVEFCTGNSSPLRAYLRQRAALVRKHPDLDSLSLDCEMPTGDRYCFRGGVPVMSNPLGTTFAFHTIWVEPRSSKEEQAD